ncbi:MAG: hypothetical protein JW754_01705 [Candidatus Aenigmarchaeota archaeon]|nr:hypothetical protein [Candidatus Aenigmarchaeota archaeon]
MDEIRENLRKFYDLANENRMISLLFVFSTLFFLLQHTTGISWDFASYVLNARYLFGSGSYFELLRPPLTPLLLGIFSVFGWVASEYVYIFFVSSLYLFSCVKVSKTLGIDRRLFYALSLNPFVLVYALSVGTELLSLALLQLFVHYALSSQGMKSGLFSGLSSLVRYTNFIYFPVILFSKKIRTVVIFVITAALVFLPWLLFNYFFYGHPLMSMLDSFILTVATRSDIVGPFEPFHLLVSGNYLIPLFLIWILLKTRDRSLGRKDWVMVLILVLTLFSYYRIPVKHPRFLFNLVLPLAYFSSVSLMKYRIRPFFAAAASIAAGLFLAFLIATSNTSIPDIILVNPSAYSIYDGECMLSTNRWVYFNYLGIPAEANPRKSRVGEYVDKGYRIIIFRDQEPDYAGNVSFLRQFPVIAEGPDYVMIGNESLCLETYAVNRTYHEYLNESIFAEYGYPVEKDPLKIVISGKY